MDRPKRVLILDDLERWREQIVEILQNEGFLVDSASGVTEALERLHEALYHVLILDLRIESESGNRDGILLLEEMEKRGLHEGIKVIVFSAYGNQERMREAFKDYKVADFLPKVPFSKQRLLDSVHKVFAQQVNIQLALEIRWQQISGPEQAIVNLEIGQTRIKPGTALQSQIADELEDLLCRLFYRASRVLIRPLTPGYSGTGVLLVQPFYTTGGGHKVVVKFGDFHKIKQEYHNFKDHVLPFLGGGRNTMVLDFRSTPRLGGIIYSLLGTINDEMRDFGEFYRRTDIDGIRGALRSLFDDTCYVWYANRGRLDLLDLTAEYQRALDYTPGEFDDLVATYLLPVQSQPKLCFKDLKKQAFTNPLPVMSGPPFLHSTYSCVTHGDFNQHNLLVDSTRHVWMIDFQETGENHILRDFAMLDSTIRFQLLGAEEAALKERLSMEEALCSIERFSQVEELASRFVTTNPALAKCYATVVYLRTLAVQLVGPQHSMSEYYVALFYNAMNALRFFSLPEMQRKHALLSASLLTDRLALNAEKQ
jgi:CheY-like chemotaxis protein